MWTSNPRHSRSRLDRKTHSAASCAMSSCASVLRLSRPPAAAARSIPCQNHAPRFSLSAVARLHVKTPLPSPLDDV
jgi:hypothetical protein